MAGRSACADPGRDLPPAPASDQAAALNATHEVAAEVLAFEREIEAAVVRSDVGFVDTASAPTLTFTHGDGWTTGGAPLRWIAGRIGWPRWPRRPSQPRR